MPEHKQMQPPNYHRCLETVFSSPNACRELLDRLSSMTEAEVLSGWSPWRGQQSPLYGPGVKVLVPAEVQLVALQATYDSYRKSTMELWRKLSDIMDIPIMQNSLVELIWSVRMRVERLNSRIEILESASAQEVPQKH